jgi:hypothetical protein
MKVEILHDKRSDKHNDSIWYDGSVARLGKYILIATGDICINQNDKDGKCIGFYDGYKGRDTFDLEMKDDSYADEVSNEFGSKYEWINNNWFEVIGDNEEDYIIGDVCYTYDEGIEMLKQYHKEKVYEENR